jgi:hypothetical protein
MASNEADEQHADPPPEQARDALGRLEERLDRASQAAERLLAGAAEHATRRPPPAGWQQPRTEEEARESTSTSGLGADADLLLALVASLRDRLPPDLQQRLAEAVREVLLALRALIDWYLERSERQPPEASEIQDIPIL